MARFFEYTRKEKVVKKDENGKEIPLKDEQGQEIKGKFETEEVNRTDFINLDKIIRVHQINDYHVVVLLDDGHEESQIVDQRLKNANKPPVASNIETTRQRVWVQSEISVRDSEVQSLYSALRA